MARDCPCNVLVCKLCKRDVKITNGYIQELSEMLLSAKEEIQKLETENREVKEANKRMARKMFKANELAKTALNQLGEFA